MARFFLGAGIVVAIITWLATSFWMFVYYGLGWALLAFLFPPADFLAMFFVGTWPLGLVATVLWGLGVLLAPKEETY